MTVKLNAFLIAEYVGAASDGKLTIAGTIDNLNYQLRAGAPTPDATNRIPMPGAYLAIVTQASIAGGLTRRFRLRILNGEGESIMPDQSFDIQYSLNPFGRLMRNSTLVDIKRVSFPGADDYVFELTVEGQDGILGTIDFTVTDTTSRPDG